MKVGNVISLVFILAAIMSVISPYAAAVPGDCNGDDRVNVSDAVMIVSWMFSGGAITNFMDCDCDGFPGINIGDIYQIYDYVYFGGAGPFAYPGEDYPVPSSVYFYYSKAIPENRDSFDVRITVDVPEDFDLEQFVLPFSFAQAPGSSQAPLTCNWVDFDGTLFNDSIVTEINNTDKVIIFRGGGYPEVILSGGSKGLLCTVNFTSGAGDPNFLKLTSVNKLWPMLFTKTSYDGINGTRVFLPGIAGTPYGDVDCSGSVNVSDAIYIINYVFSGGPAPGDCEP